MRKINLFPTISDVEEMSGLNRKEAVRLYRRKYVAVLFSWHGLVAVCMAVAIMAAFNHFVGGLARVAGWFLGTYVMFIYIFHKMDLKSK